MALRKLLRRYYSGKSPKCIKFQNLHSFKEGMILLCQSILETRIISRLHDSAFYTIPLKLSYICMSWSSLKTDMETIFLGQDECFQMASFSQEELFQ